MCYLDLSRETLRCLVRSAQFDVDPLGLAHDDAGGEIL